MDPERPEYHRCNLKWEPAALSSSGAGSFIAHSTGVQVRRADLSPAPATCCEDDASEFRALGCPRAALFPTNVDALGQRVDRRAEGCRQRPDG